MFVVLLSLPKSREVCCVGKVDSNVRFVREELLKISAPLCKLDLAYSGYLHDERKCSRGLLRKF